jgi:hypothetical protein
LVENGNGGFGLELAAVSVDLIRVVGAVVGWRMDDEVKIFEVS